jgi:hypothetical protein
MLDWLPMTTRAATRHHMPEPGFAIFVVFSTTSVGLRFTPAFDTGVTSGLHQLYPLTLANLIVHVRPSPEIPDTF